jgi:prolyl-tRNA synthetase
MRLSKMFMPTRKEDPADAEVASHKLLVRGGYIRMLTRGIYSFLPLGWRSVRKIEQIVREEMDRAGAQEVLMPSVQPAGLWQESGRWDEYGPELLRIKDRKDSEFCLGPTHEEVITDLIRRDINSYKDLPLNLYQIQTKFRDEPRPRFGLMRGREFIMKDAYSFDINEEGADASYEQMFDAYKSTCERLGFDYVAVEADTGNIGGSKSHEFQVLADTGEDEIVSCPECGYAANAEMAEIQLQSSDAEPFPPQDLELVDTPGKKTVDEVRRFLNIDETRVLKTLVFNCDDTPVVVLVRGDQDANEIKIRRFLTDSTDITCDEINLAGDRQVSELTDAPVGFAGPIGLDVPVFADLSVQEMTNFAVGANEADKHYTNVNHGRDFDVTAFADFRRAKNADLCGRCGTPFEAHRGIEIGHVFYLGTKYSEAMGASVQDENGQMQPLIMGCYGIGVTRILAAVVEQNHDEDGIIWPMPIAPYQAIVLPLQMRNDEVVDTGQKLYDELSAAGIEVLLDDRDAGVGQKFKDADLIGIPVRIAIGSRGLEDGHVEIKRRSASDIEDVPVAEAVEYVKKMIAEATA